MEAEVFVLEADAGGLAVGQPAEVVIVEARPERDVHRRRSTTSTTLAKPRIRGVPVQYFGVDARARRDRPDGA